MISDSEFQNIPLLVLGGSGRLGRMLRHYWPKADDLVAQSRAGGVGLLGFDVLGAPDQLDAAMHGKRGIVCLSGLTPAYAARHGGEMSVNTDLACAAINAAARTGVPRVFLASSAAVYGAESGPFAENALLYPVSDYGNAKAEMETAAKTLARDIGVKITILRIGNVAGADAILGGWTPEMQLDQLPDGTTPRRSYIGPKTFARVLYELSLIMDLPTVLNIAAPGTLAMGDLLNAAGLAWSPRLAHDGVLAKVALQTTALEQLVDIAPNEGEPARMAAEWAAMKGLFV